MLSRSKIFVTAVLLCLWLACINPAWTQISSYQTAMSLVQQGKFDQALSLLQQILDQSPNDLKARNLMGIALSGAGRREEANEQFKKALALEPKFVPPLKNLAVNELALCQTENAKLHFEEALKLLPQDPTCHWGLAEIAFAARDFERALSEYEQSSDLALTDPQVTIRFATSYFETKQPDRAAVLLEKIPWNTDANLHFQVGLMLARLEKFQAAARRFELARNGFSDPYRVGYNLMLVLVKQRDYAAAIRAGEEMVAAGYRKAEMHNLLAQAYEKSGKTRDAYESLRAATQLEPQDENNYLDLITLCMEHDNYKLSQEIADIGVRLIPRSHRLHLQRGVVLAMKGEFEEAVKEFEASSRLSSETGLSQVAMSLALIQMDKLPDAIDVLRRQSVRSPKNPEVFWFLGEALSRSAAPPGSEGEREAIGALEKSIQLNPRLPQPRALLGKMLLRRGEIDRAIEELQKALQLDPEDLTATYQLAQALQRKGDTARAEQLFAKVSKAKSEDLESLKRNLLRIFKAGSR